MARVTSYRSHSPLDLGVAVFAGGLGVALGVGFASFFTSSFTASLDDAFLAGSETDLRLA